MSGMRWIGHILHRYSYMGSYGPLYLEESGVPLPAPGDVFVMYVGAHVPRSLGSWVLAWLGRIGAVVLGATNPVLHLETLRPAPRRRAGFRVPITLASGEIFWLWAAVVVGMFVLVVLRRNPAQPTPSLANMQ